MMQERKNIIQHHVLPGEKAPGHKRVKINVHWCQRSEGKRETRNIYIYAYIIYSRNIKLKAGRKENQMCFNTYYGSGFLFEVFSHY